MSNNKDNKKRRLYDFDAEENQKTESVKVNNNYKKSNSKNEIYIGIESPINNSKKKKSKTKLKAKRKNKEKTSEKRVNKNKTNTNSKKSNSTRINLTEENLLFNKQKMDYYEENDVPKKSYIKLKVFLLLVLIIGIITFAMISPIFNLKTIKVVGNSSVSQEEIIELSHLNYGTNIFRISKSEISKSIKKNGYIESVKITRGIPNTIIIEVKERKIDFVIQTGNSSICLNNQGYILEETTEEVFFPKLVGTTTSIEELVVGKRLNQEDLVKLDIVLKIMQEAEINGIKQLIYAIDITNDKDIKLNLDSEGKVVHLGDASNISARINNLKIIIEKSKGKSGEIFIDMDLNYKNPFLRENS